MKYPIEILLGLAGIAAVAAPIVWPIAGVDEADKAQPVIAMTPVSEPPLPAPASLPETAWPAGNMQPPQQPAPVDLWRPERTTPAAAPSQAEAAPQKLLPPGTSRALLDRLVAAHAKANDVPQVLVHRVIMRESRYQPELIGHGGTIGLMQIKLATARGLGYTGDAEGLRNPDTNLAYGVKYLAGAYRVANGDHDRAIHYYAAGYYEAAKRWRLARYTQPAPIVASAAVNETTTRESALNESAPAERAEPNTTENETITSGPAVTPEPSTKPVEAGAKPKRKPIAAKQKNLLKLLVDAEAEVRRPPAPIPAGAKSANPR